MTLVNTFSQIQGVLHCDAERNDLWTTDLNTGLSPDSGLDIGSLRQVTYPHTCFPCI